jgi:hypothetical protein
VARKHQDIYQIKVTLNGVTPPIWRRIHIAGDCTLAQLHRTLQIAMGWENYHLYEFHIGRKIYCLPDEDGIDERRLIDPKRERIQAVLPTVGTAFAYVYDLGDYWQHGLLLEAILMPVQDAVYPQCIAGERSCPPEDVGGTSGYEHYLEALADPSHEDHEDMMAWRGPFAPESFSIEQVNRKLQKQSRGTRKPNTLQSSSAQQTQ